MNRREILKASIVLPLLPASRLFASSDTGRAGTTLHVTFLYHCAFASWDADRRTDVLLSPGSVHAPHGTGVPAHVAVLRVPAACLRDDSEHPGTDDQGDRIWRLEGFDISLSIGEEPVTRTTRSWDVALKGGAAAAVGAPSVWAIANLDRLTGGPAIDQACVAADPPAFLQRGARVRLVGGHLGCGLPTTQGLREIAWDLGVGGPVGLSDRADYVKAVDETVIVAFRRFGESTTRRVLLQPDANGVVRGFVSNDPLDGDGDCSALPHFALYYLLGKPVGVVKNLRVPGAHSRAALQAQGVSVCCPCSGGTTGP